MKKEEEDRLRTRRRRRSSSRGRRGKDVNPNTILYEMIASLLGHSPTLSMTPSPLSLGDLIQQAISPLPGSKTSMKLIDLEVGYVVSDAL